jgi:hypothetical protein
MRSICRTPITTHRWGGVAVLLLGAVLLAFSVAVAAQDYDGSDSCVQCHEQNWNEWQVSGHPYKLMSSEEARNRPIPLPEGLDWDDVTYVIGGYKWKSRYLQSDGYVYTPAEGKNQYNMLTGEWSDYHAGELKPYDCGQCHTTGWVANPNPEDTDGNQGGLPGIHGKFFTGGVHCEACHGPGANFDTGMQVDNSAEACGTCHHRTAAPGAEENVIPASGGFIRHHEQYNEHLAGPHATLDCVDCHNPHEKSNLSIWKDGERREWSGLEDEKVGAGAQCGVDCHDDVMASYSQTSMYDYGVECQDCHMPFASKSAQALGPNQGDVMTHIFYINTEAVDRSAMFTEDGGAVLLDEDGKAMVTMDFACQRCHETASLDELAKFAKDFHEADKTLEDVGLTPGLTGHWYTTERSGEGFMLHFGNTDNGLTLFASFYTYAPDGTQLWLVAISDSIDGTTADVTVYVTSGRSWGEITGNLTEVWGTGSFTFADCDNGTMSLTPNATYEAAGFTPLSYDINRTDFTITSEVGCPTFVNNAE